MFNQPLRHYLLPLTCCLAMGLFAGCESQGPNKDKDDPSTKETSNHDGDASTDSDSPNANTSNDESAVDATDHDEHDGHDHDGDDHDHDGHDHDHGGHDHADTDIDKTPTNNLAATPTDFTMNLDGMPTTKLIDPSKVIDVAALGMPIHPSGLKSSTNKQAMEDLIYANIRIRMDSDAALRRAMIEEGVAPTDPGIRQLEGQIRKARELLEQSGETLAPVDPPIQ